jgi:8-oxo-dGTP pyrophosphatase MutT (NUDIX family)
MKINNMSENLALYRIVCGAVLVNESTREILLLKRSQTGGNLSGNWELPAGHVNHGEDIASGLRREVYEETGISEFNLKNILRVTQLPSLESDKPAIPRLCVVYWATTLISQVALSSEHVDYQWLGAEKAVEIATLNGIKQEIQIYIDNFKLND